MPQHREFIGESGWFQIVFDGLSPGVTFVGRARVDMRQDAADDIHIVSYRRPCRSGHTTEVSQLTRYVSIKS